MLLVSPQHNKQDLMQQSLLASLVLMDSLSLLSLTLAALVALLAAFVAALVALVALVALEVLEPKASFSVMPTSVSLD